MAVVRKTDPKGVDIGIDRMQTTLFDNLTSLGWTDYEVYPRAYKNYKGENKIPEIYVGNGEYREVLFDDTKNVTSFFLVDDNTNVEFQKLTTDVSLIFQANLLFLYPSIGHRADEEMHVDIFNSVKNNSIGFNLTGITTGVRNVYSDLEIRGNIEDLVKLDDISYYHVAKLDFTVPYEIRKTCTKSVQTDMLTVDSNEITVDSDLITADQTR